LIRITDASKLWRVAQLGLAKTIQKARRRLVSWEFPIATLEAQSERQVRCEAALNPTLDTLSDPTATATQLFFAHGAELICAELSERETMATLGDAFGRLVYVLDALEDREADAKKRQFNALAATDSDQAATRRYLLALQQTALDCLAKLPIQSDVRAMLAARLRGNVTKAIGASLPMATEINSDDSDGQRKPGAVTVTPVKKRSRRTHGGRDCCHCGDACRDIACCCTLESCCEGCGGCACESCCSACGCCAA
jgi:hypothetical protein